MANINKIRVSGTTYNIQDINAPKVIELTQSEYDALTVKDPNAFYVITDSEYNFDGYWTSAQTQNAIAQSVSSKADTSAVTSVNDSLTAHTANTTVHVTAQDKTNWNAKSDFSGNYNDLTNKPTIPTVPTNVSDFTNDAGYITSDDITGKTNVSDFTAHTANTTVHVTANEKATWNAKSDFSGNYNDLSNKPTIPSKTSDLTNDSNFATTGDVQTATNDMATKTWVGQQGYLTEHQDISGKQDVSGMTAYTETSAFTAHTADTTIHVTSADKAAWNAKSDFSGSYNDLTNKLSAGTNITIDANNVISAEGGGKAVSGGTNISITTGETADTINCTLPIYINPYAGRGDINIGTENNANYDYYRIAIGRRINMSSVRGGGSIAIGVATNSSSEFNKCYGDSNVAIGRLFQIGESDSSSGVKYGCVVIGYKAKSLVNNGVAIGSETTVSGTTQTNINNQLMIDTSNQIYIYNKDNTEMICLQDQLGGGGSSYTAGDGIDITNDVISVTGKVDTSAFTAHTADTVIHVTSAEKAAWNAKSDFSGSYNDLTNKPTIPTSASQLTNDTGYITSSALDGYATTATTSALNDTLTAHTADTTIHVTSSDKSSWNGAATNASNAITALGGLSLVKLTQAEYDALATKDSNTLYVING